MTKRVVHLTTAHARGEVRIFLKECLSLSSGGYDVHLMVADGLGSAVVDGVTIHDAGAFIGRFQRMLILPWRMYFKARKLKALSYHYHEPELHFIALPLLFGGSRVIYDSHEDVPRAILSREWINIKLRRFVSKTFELFENFITKRISAVVGATDHIARRFSQMNERSVAINNYPLATEISDELVGREVNRNVCYIGGISLARGIVEMVNAMEHIDARLILAGPFETDAVEQYVRNLPGWGKVEYRGNVNRKEVHEIMALSQAGLLFFHPEPNHVDAQPNKMFEYMSSGLPVLASNFPLWKLILEDSNVGWQADPLDSNAIAQLIDKVVSDPSTSAEMGRKGRQMVLSQYQWLYEEKKLLSLYSELIK
jgi:glycosyltransferase involved in cell wall biosynthesis